MDWDCVSIPEVNVYASPFPLLRRAFSIAGFTTIENFGETTLDIIYRVVGKATTWLQSLVVGDSISCLGPLGNAFPISKNKKQAWLVAGGVGLPPLLWLAEAMRNQGKTVVAFCGAQSRILFPLSIIPQEPLDPTAQQARLSVLEFARHGVATVLSTDDGSLGFHGRITEALSRYRDANPGSSDTVAVYTCGPEPMMKSVADIALKHGLECHVCMERNMACGLGTCQSCVVPVHDTLDDEGWSYKLCCTDGPIFRADEVIWKSARHP